MLEHVRLTPVARLIAKDPPDWLVIGLQEYAGFIATDPTASKEAKQYLEIIWRMHDATATLIKFLPLFEKLPLGQCPDDVAIALDVLPRIKKLLSPALAGPGRGGGPMPNIQRRVCAAVVVEAWRLVHGKPDLRGRSDQLYLACQEYWRACTGEDRGDIENWRRDAERAVADDYSAIRRRLMALGGT